jgi:hypothetical protein
MPDFSGGLKWKHLEAIQRLEQVLERGRNPDQNDLVSPVAVSLGWS